MLVRGFVLLVLLVLLSGCGDDDGYVAPTPSGSYAPLLESPIRGLTPTEIEQLETGAGMQLALPGELNGYPGPKHVLELAGELGLGAEQHASVQRLYDETNAEARRVGAQVLDAYRALDQWFREGGSDAAELGALLDAVAASEADLRQVHLAAHVLCKDLLTEHQVQRYNELRGYGAGGHDQHAGHAMAS